MYKCKIISVQFTKYNVLFSPFGFSKWIIGSSCFILGLHKVNYTEKYNGENISSHLSKKQKQKKNITKYLIELIYNWSPWWHL